MPKPQNRLIRDRDRVGDREFHGGDRRVTFKQGRYGGGGGKNKNRDWTNAIREHLMEEDIDMNIGPGQGRNFKKGGTGVKGRKGSPTPNVYRKLSEVPTGWYKIVIPFGEKYEKSFLEKLLLDKVAPLPFWPIAWQSQAQGQGQNNAAICFFVDDYEVANKLYKLDKQVQLPDGFPLFVKVYPGTPNVDMKAETKEKIKLVMAKRYNAATKALDLTKFHADPDLQNTFCALFKPIVFLAILDIIEENIPDLEALCLNENRITTFTFCKKMSKKVPNLKILHVANNKLRDLAQLDALAGMPLLDLMLDGNPLCSKYKEQSTYISEVQKKFPKCVKLDGLDLPPPISFDIAEEGHLPEPQQTFLCASEGEVIVRQFLEQFFAIYDSEERRQHLMQAYHESAVFSYTTAYPHGLQAKERATHWLTWYNTDNRNLLKVRDIDRRVRLLKKGNLGIVSFIQEMPLTKHDIHSFTVDLTLFTPQMISLTVTGMFRELKSGHKTPPLRYFFRTLVIVPNGTGFCIGNDTYHVSNATPEQAQKAFKTPSLPVPTPGTAAPPSTPEASPLAPPLDNATKEEMVKQMALKTGMNLEWTIKCLEGNDWDFLRAGAVFDSLQSQGSIPPEAFVK